MRPQAADSRDTHPIPLTPLDPWIAAKIGQPAQRVALRTLRAYQVDRLNETLAHAAARSQHYRHLLGKRPPVLSSLDELTSLPFTTPGELQAAPYDFLCVQPDDVARIVTLPTSGTTGSPKRLFFTAEDQELTRDFFHHGMSTLVGPGSQVDILLPGTLPGSVGALIEEGLQRMDVTSIVLGPVIVPEETLQAMSEAAVNAIVGIPVQVLELALLCQRDRTRWPLRITSVLLSTDYVPRSVVKTLKEIWGCEVYNHYGMTEMGLGGGVDCRALSGYHLREADLLFEIIDPQSGDPLPEGERGEVVFTTLTRIAMPLIRYRTGDHSRFIPEPCACGSALPRLAHIDGRVGSAVQTQAGPIRLQELDECLLGVHNIVDFQAVVGKGPTGPELEVFVKQIGRTDAVPPADSPKSVVNTLAYPTKGTGDTLESLAQVEERLRDHVPALARTHKAMVPLHVHVSPQANASANRGTGKRTIISNLNRSGLNYPIDHPS